MPLFPVLFLVFLHVVTVHIVPALLRGALAALLHLILHHFPLRHVFHHLLLLHFFFHLIFHHALLLSLLRLVLHFLAIGVAQRERQARSKQQDQRSFHWILPFGYMKVTTNRDALGATIH